MSLDRRSFLKGSALVAATGVLSSAVGCAPSAQSSKAEKAGVNSTDSLPAGTYATDFGDSVIELDWTGSVESEETYDIVVVGAGCSGLPAILTALEEGATVGVLQKESDAVANGNGCAAVLLDYSNDCGVKRWISDWQKENNWRINTELFKYYIDHSAETFSWMVQQAQSVDFVQERFNTRGTISYDDGGLIAMCSMSSKSNDELMKKLIVKAQDQGAVVHFDTPAIQIEKDADGRVTSVIGKAKDGSYIRMNATKAVILAAGDYMNNDSMVDRYLSDCKHLMRAQTNRTGDGHLLATLAGGRITGVCHAKQCHDLGATGSTFMSTPFLALDKNGQRFYNEECPMTSWDIVLKYRYPNEEPWFYRFFDSDYETKYKGVGQVPPVNVLESNLAENDPTGRKQIYRADTIAELCKTLELDEKSVQASIDRYNGLCAKGVDDDFGKKGAYMQPVVTAPFYCIKNHTALSTINAGVEVDGHYQVKDENDNPIPGLFAVGVDGGNLCGGLEWSMPGGVSNGHCFNAGRYSVIYALTGDLVPKKACAFEDIKELFTANNGQLMWETPEKASKQIEVW